MTQSDVETLLPVITRFKVPALINTLYDIAYDQFTIDAPSCLGTSKENTAIVYYIASMLASGAGKFGMKSEKIDDYAVAFADDGETGSYLTKYQQIIDNCNYHALVSGISTGQARADTLDYLDLDNAGILDGSTEGEFT